MVTAFTRIEGPCYVGPRTQLFVTPVPAPRSAPSAASAARSNASIVHGHSNKYHDGFLGHSYVGEWVNLSAGTQQQRPAQRLWPGHHLGRRPNSVEHRSKQGRLLPGRPHQDRPRHPSQHGLDRRRLLQPSSFRRLFAHASRRSPAGGTANSATTTTCPANSRPPPQS